MKLYQDPERLSQAYWGQGLTMHEIGRIAGCSRENVRQWMNKLGIPRRPVGKPMVSLDAGWLWEQYWENGLSVSRIAEIASCSSGTVDRCLHDYNIPLHKDFIAPRFWNQVLILGPDECWEWQGGCKGGGYGHIYADEKAWGAHRLAWILAYGEIPEGMHICHHCDNPPCCNPSHLFMGTHADNMADRDAKGRGQLAHLASAKLTESQVLEIRKLWDETDLTQHEIGEMFGIHNGTVCRIVRHKSWAYLGGSK